MNKKLAYLISFFLFISLVFFLITFSKEPVNDDLKSNLRKRVIAMALEKPKFKEHKKSFNKGSVKIKKYDSRKKAISSSLQTEINKYDNQLSKNIRIVLNTTDDTDELSNRVESYGGQILRKRPNFLAIEVPVNKVEQLIEENNAVDYARLPFKFYPLGEITEGVELTGASAFHNTDLKGEGIKIAVLDVGFKGMAEAISNGDLPDGMQTRDFSGNGLETEYYHGTACAEIVYDMAPEAELHLLKMGDEIAGYDAIDYCIENDIDIVTMSVGTFGSGPGDGTGPVDEAFDELREARILVITSAGNFSGRTYDIEGVLLSAGSHWEGSFTDTDSDGYHEFKGDDSDSYYNIIGADPGWDDDGTSLTSEITIVMRWNNWADSNIDYDMYLYEYNYEAPEIGTLVASSTTAQTGTQDPVEYIVLDMPDSQLQGGFYALKINIKADSGSPTGAELEVYLGGTSQFYPFMHINGTYNTPAIATPGSSLSEPADAESVLAVGAVNHANWTTGPQEEYSSQGPTNAWNNSAARTKPDIIGPDVVTTYTYGDSSFSGTSAAAPHLAGLAALTLSMNPYLTPDELQAFLEENTIDMGKSGKDDLYGWGRMNSVLIPDTDNDGMPDSWEIDYGLDPNINDAAGDLDGDAYSNVNEFIGGTYPNDSDTDDDGMPDGWEVQFGLNPLLNDSAGDLDGDGFDNLEEYQEETLPNDPKSKPKTGLSWLMLLLGDD